MALPTMGYTLPYQSFIKRQPHRFASRQLLWRHFLSWCFVLSDDSSLYQVDKAKQKNNNKRKRNRERKKQARKPKQHGSAHPESLESHREWKRTLTTRAEAAGSKQWPPRPSVDPEGSSPAHGSPCTLTSLATGRLASCIDFQPPDSPSDQCFQF